MFYILLNTIPDVEKDAILDGQFQDEWIYEIAFNQGKYIDVFKNNAVANPITFYINPYVVRGRMTDRLSITNINGLVFSKKVKEVLEGCSIEKTQFFPIRIVDSYHNIREVQLADVDGETVDFNTEIYEDYFICNLCEVVDALDHHASEVEYFNPMLPDVDIIKSLGLQSHQISEQQKIFRLADCPRIVVFKEEVVQAIKKANLTGFVFVPISEYTEDVFEEKENHNFQKEQKKESPKHPPKPQTLTSDLEDLPVKKNKPLTNNQPSLTSDLFDDTSPKIRIKKIVRH